MKNADKPIKPLKNAVGGYFTEQDEDYLKNAKPFIGLTKREYAAIEVLKGMLSNHLIIDNFNCQEELVKQAIIFTDELLTQLETK